MTTPTSRKRTRTQSTSSPSPAAAPSPLPPPIRRARRSSHFPAPRKRKRRTQGQTQEQAEELEIDTTPPGFGGRVLLDQIPRDVLYKHVLSFLNVQSLLPYRRLSKRWNNEYLGVGARAINTAASDPADEHKSASSSSVTPLSSSSFSYLSLVEAAHFQWRKKYIPSADAFTELCKTMHALKQVRFGHTRDRSALLSTPHVTALQYCTALTSIDLRGCQPLSEWSTGRWHPDQILTALSSCTKLRTLIVPGSSTLR